MRGVNGQGMFRGAPNGGFHDDHRYKMSIKPEHYDGGEDWEEYISHFEICAELGKWHETDKVLALAAALRGPARTFYISLGQEEKRNYAALIERLGLKFGSTRQQNALYFSVTMVLVIIFSSTVPCCHPYILFLSF
jgi:hypothetical protein